MHSNIEMDADKRPGRITVCRLVVRRAGNCYVCFVFSIYWVAAFPSEPHFVFPTGLVA